MADCLKYVRLSQPLGCVKVDLRRLRVILCVGNCTRPAVEWAIAMLGSARTLCAAWMRRPAQALVDFAPSVASPQARPL